MTDSLSFETPEFIAWCLVRECPVRGRFDLDDPLQTERRLKSLRAAAIGWMEGRVVEGWVVEPSFTNRDPVELRGFPLADVVDRWGGSAQLTELCGSCPANALQRSYEIDPANFDSRPTAWAGCMGLLPLNGPLASLPTELETLRESRAADLVRLASSSPPIDDAEWRRSDSAPPRCVWAEIWRSAPLAGDGAAAAHGLLSTAMARITWSTDKTTAASGNEPTSPVPLASRRDWLQLDAALRIASQSDPAISLAVAHLPAGAVNGRRWTWFERCQYCLATKQDRKRCQRCGLAGPPVNLSHRGARGERPYRRLADLLGVEEIRRLLQALEALRRDSSERTAAKAADRD
ncbi:MAG: hypothetical protein KDA83_01770 [Planctomycetales bacterium]|nr:hypothetical protein [Planctomycetales bacterium]